MLVIILCLFALMFIVGNKVNQKSVLAKRFLFVSLLIWFACLFFSIINIYRLNSVSDSTYLLIILNVISFFLGFCVIKAAKDSQDKKIEFNNILYSRVFKIILYFSCAVSFYMAITQIRIIAISGLGLVREDFWEVMFEGQPFWLAFSYTFILQALFFFVLPLIIYCMEHRKHYFQLIIMILFVFSYSFTAGGRIRFLFIAVGACLYLMARYKLRKPDKSSRAIIISFVTLAILAATAISTLRAGEKEVGLDNLTIGLQKNVHQLIVYNTGSFIALDQFLESNYQQNDRTPYIIRATFGGFEEFISKIFGKLGLPFKHINESTVYYFQNKEINIGGGESFNYAYTNLIFHYFDLGVLGVFLYPFLFGVFVKKTINRMNKNGSGYLFCLLVFLFVIMYHSPFTLLITKPFAIPYIIILLYLDRKQFSKKQYNVC